MKCAKVKRSLAEPLASWAPRQCLSRYSHCLKGERRVQHCRLITAVIQFQAATQYDFHYRFFCSLLLCLMVLSKICMKIQKNSHPKCWDLFNGPKLKQLKQTTNLSLNRCWIIFFQSTNQPYLSDEHVGAPEIACRFFRSRVKIYIVFSL